MRSFVVRLLQRDKKRIGRYCFYPLSSFAASFLSWPFLSLFLWVVLSCIYAASRFINCIGDITFPLYRVRLNSVSRYVKKSSGKLPIELVRHYAAEIISALQYMHTCRIVHRDLKPDNILLDSDCHLLLVSAYLIINGLNYLDWLWR